MAEKLTPAQYRFIERVQKEELRLTLRDQKVNVLAVYLDQAQSLLSFLASSSKDVFSNPQDAVRRFAEIDLFIETFNEEITPSLESGEDSMIELSAFQTEEVLRAANFTFNFGAEFVRGADKLIQDTRKYNNNFKLSESIWGKDKRDQFYKDILNGINSGQDRQEITKRLEERLLKKGNGGQFYNVERVLDTEYNNAYRLGRVESSRQWNSEGDPNDPLIYTWNLSPAHKVKDICDDLEGGYELESQVPSTPHANCFTGETPVFAKNVKATFKSEYKGKLVDITTKSGLVLSVTPNHPMLTTDGWVPAGQLNETHNLIKTTDRFKRIISAYPHIKTVESLIKDIRISGGMIFSRMPVSSIDFHGDGAFYKKVDVIFKNRKLKNIFDIKFFKVLHKKKLVFRSFRFLFNSFSSLNKRLFRGFSTSRSLISFFSNLVPVRFRHFFIDQFRAFRLASFLDAISNQNTVNNTSTTTKDLSKLHLSFPGLVEFDKLIVFGFREFDGHVYNLTTKGNWYVSNDIITHNCKCFSGEIFKSDFRGRMKKLKTRGGVYKSPNFKNQKCLMV